jgi:uncharacterized protein (TIGR02246 family)
MGALYLEDATFIQIFGGQLNGRTAIEASHRAIFDTIYKGSRATFAVHGIRFLRPDIALVFICAHVDFFEANEPREISLVPASAQAAGHIAT